MDDGTDCLEDLPPSAKLVFKVLEYDGPLTQQAITEESLLAGRTVRFALDRLEECGHVEERVYAADARQRLYEVVDATEESAAAGNSDGSGHPADAGQAGESQQSTDSRPSESVSTEPDTGS